MFNSVVVPVDFSTAGNRALPIPIDRPPGRCPDRISGGGGSWPGWTGPTRRFDQHVRGAGPALGHRSPAPRARSRDHRARGRPRRRAARPGHDRQGGARPGSHGSVSECGSSRCRQRCSWSAHASTSIEVSRHRPRHRVEAPGSTRRPAGDRPGRVPSAVTVRRSSRYSRSCPPIAEHAGRGARSRQRPRVRRPGRRSTSRPREKCIYGEEPASRSPITPTTWTDTVPRRRRPTAGRSGYALAEHEP